MQRYKSFEGCVYTHTIIQSFMCTGLSFTCNRQGVAAPVNKAPPTSSFLPVHRENCHRITPVSP